MKRRAGIFCTGLLVMLVASGGCQERRTLATTPNILLSGNGSFMFSQVPPELRTPDMPILYVTDRAVTKMTDTGPRFGHQRSRTISFGVATVSVTPQPTWDQLVADSLTDKRSASYELKTTAIREIGTMPSVLPKMDYRRHELIMPPAATTQIADENKQFIDELEARLARTPTKEVFIYVHGFANTFDDAVFRAAELWHFMGRVGVPIAYTWPSGSSGLFAYFKDRESGEFTVYHLKRILRLVIDCPAVERLHIIGHSRGTDVATTAIRELSLELLGEPSDLRKTHKLQTLVLASPDLDGEVFLQRFMAEQLVALPNRMVIYFSPNDLALKASALLFGGNRLGRLNTSSFTPDVRRKIADFETLELIECNVSGHSSSHDYEFADPAVLSDLILAVRDRRDPGDGRPLRVQSTGVWEISNKYGLRESDKDQK